MSEPPNSNEDLDRIARPEEVLSAAGSEQRKPSPSGQSAAALERDLEIAKRKIANHNSERLLAAIFLLILWDVSIFQDFDSWAAVIGILILQLIGLFVLAYRLELDEIVKLYWGTMRAYGQNDPGEPPEKRTR